VPIVGILYMPMFQEVLRILAIIAVDVLVDSDMLST